MRERLSKMQTEDDLDSRRAPWMALAEAGFGMAAGESQFALQNVGKGASQGIKSFIAARGNVRKAEERRFELENKLGQAERSEQIAGITYGMESKRADDARKTTVGLAQQTDKARTAEVNAKGVYDAKKDNLTFAQKETEMRLNSADNAARIASLDRNVTRQIKSAENTAVRDDLKFRLGLFKSTLTEVNTAITEARKAFPPDEALIKDLQQQFNSTFTAMSALANQGGDNTGSGAAANMRSYFTK